MFWKWSNSNYVQWHILLTTDVIVVVVVVVVMLLNFNLNTVSDVTHYKARNIRCQDKTVKALNTCFMLI
jgi:hypothetical protein